MDRKRRAGFLHGEPVCRRAAAHRPEGGRGRRGDSRRGAEPDDRLAAEMADLIYHCLVLLAARDLRWKDVEQELARRFK